MSARPSTHKLLHLPPPHSSSGHTKHTSPQDWSPHRKRTLITTKLIQHTPLWGTKQAPQHNFTTNVLHSQLFATQEQFRAWKWQLPDRVCQLDTLNRQQLPNQTRAARLPHHPPHDTPQGIIWSLHTTVEIHEMQRLGTKLTHVSRPVRERHSHKY